MKQKEATVFEKTPASSPLFTLTEIKILVASTQMINPKISVNIKKYLSIINSHKYNKLWKKRQINN